MVKDTNTKQKELSTLEKKVLKLASEFTPEELKAIKKLDLSLDELTAMKKILKEPQRPVAMSYDHSKGEGNDSTILRLFHPGKGTAYALSYQVQKWAEALPGGQKPHIAAVGHYHKMEQLFYRNIHIFQTGTFEAQTPFMRERNIAAMTGAWVVWVNKEKPFGLLSDTHLGSKWHLGDKLQDYYDIAWGEGVRNFYHAGDITSGENMYRGQVYEIHAHGLSAQVKEVVENYPKRRGQKTFFITGNHDLSFRKQSGADIGEIIDFKREDLVYLGQTEADVKVSKEPIRTIKSMFVPYY